MLFSKGWEVNSCWVGRQCPSGKEGRLQQPRRHLTNSFFCWWFFFLGGSERLGWFFFSWEYRPRIVSAVSTEEAEETCLHGVAVRCRLGWVSSSGGGGGGGVGSIGVGWSWVACCRVAVTWVGLLGGHWSSSRGGQHKLLAWLHKHKNTQYSRWSSYDSDKQHWNVRKTIKKIYIYLFFVLLT